MNGTRCFIAVELSREIIRELEKMQGEIKETGTSASFPKASQMHLTLAFYASQSESEVEKKIVLLRQTLQHSKQFALRVHGIGFLPNENEKIIKVVYAGIESWELLELQAHIAHELDYKEDREFFPHATLARIKDARHSNELRALGEKYAKFEFGKCIVEKVFFKKSTLTPQGPLYENLAEFILQ